MAPSPDRETFSKCCSTAETSVPPDTSSEIIGYTLERSSFSVTIPAETDSSLLSAGPVSEYTLPGDADRPVRRVNAYTYSPPAPKPAPTPPPVRGLPARSVTPDTPAEPPRNVAA